MAFFSPKKRLLRLPPADNEMKRLIKGGLRKWGDKLAIVLSQQEQKLSLQTKKIITALFCLIMTAFSLTFLYRGLFVWNSRPASYFSKPGVAVPITPHLPDSMLLKLSKKANQDPSQPPTPPHSLTP